MGDLVKYIRGLEADTIAALNRERAFLVTRAASPDAVLFEPRSEGEALWRIVRANALKAAGAGATQEFAKLGTGLAFNTLNPRVQDYLNEKELVIKTIPKSWHDRLRAELLAGNKAGEPVTEITKRVESVYGDMQTWQARRIAQTETVGAYNNGAYSAMVTAEVGKKKWVATLDDKVRDAHAVLHGKVVGMKEPFVTIQGDRLQHPGDPRAPGRAIIHCRCSMVAVVEKGAARPAAEGAGPVPAVTKPAGLPKFNAGGKWDAAEMQKEEARLAKLLDQANTAEAAEATKARIAKALAGRLDGNAGWQKYVDEAQAAHAQTQAALLGQIKNPELAAKYLTAGNGPSSESLAADIVSKWAGTSGDTNAYALSMQMAARDEFGLGEAAIEHLAANTKAWANAEAIYTKDGDALRAFLRAQYDETQEWLAKEGIEDVLVYRGQGMVEKEYLAVQEAGGKGTLNTALQPLSSFSADHNKARLFAVDAEGDPAILSVRVPANRILGSSQTGYGCKDEAEFVVLGGKDEVRVTLQLHGGAEEREALIRADLAAATNPIP